MYAVPVIAVVGGKNSGKTTLVEGLVRQLRARGYRVGTIKRGHHAFTVDQPGKDSWRHAEAGAEAVFIVGGDRMALIRRTESEPDPARLAAMCPDMDIFLAEGYKRSALPKIEVCPVGSGQAPVCAGDPMLVALAADDPDKAACIRPDVPHFHRDQVGELADFIEASFLDAVGGGDWLD